MLVKVATKSHDAICPQFSEPHFMDEA